MPVLKIKNNGVWEDIMGGASSSSMNGGNADTLDGKHASDFALAADVADLQNKVGDEAVSTQINTAIANKADRTHVHDTATDSTPGFMSPTYKIKIDGIEPGANAYTHPTMSGYMHIPSGGANGQILKWSDDGIAAWADSDSTSTCAIPGPSAENNGMVLKSTGDDIVWAENTDTTYSVATQEKNGLMSAADKKALDNMSTLVGDEKVSSQISKAIESKQDTITGGATTITKNNLNVNRALISDANGKVGTSTVTNTELGYLSGATSNIQTQLNSKSSSDHTHNNATASSSGLMSASDKSKLDSIDTGAGKITVDSALNSTSTNPVQNKVVSAAIDDLSSLIGDTKVSDQISEAISDMEVTVTTTGSGNAITSASVNGNTITLNKGTTFSASYHGHSLATTSISGFMSPTDKSTLDKLNTLVGSTSVQDQINEAINDHTHSTATTSANGFMSSADKSTLDSLSTLVGDKSVSDQINEAIGNISTGKTLAKHLEEESMVLTSLQYGTTLPAAGTKGRIFFKKVSS